MPKLEKSVNEYGQEQLITTADKVVKIGDIFLEVRLIRTQKFRASREGRKEFTEPMPRARFSRQIKNPYYLIRKDDLIKLKGRKNDRKT